ncbi:MAG: glycosyltransferase family A protein [Actinomycetota bacterium]|nr:glycosyltransferase family A protein [Actinomycetota bacterium]
MDKPRISFGMIVLNGQPFVPYNLEALYPFAHEIIVVEGATTGAASIADENGHSTDGTLDALFRFKECEDPEDKVRIITREGCWDGKDAQSRAYAELATGDYLWQVDVDEFYSPDDMRTIVDMLDKDREITAVSFKQITFWGDFDTIADSWYLRRGADEYHRLFKWGEGYRYLKHRPPTVVDPSGRDMRTLKWVDGHQLAERHIYLYHYSLVFPELVKDKCLYYSQAGWDHSYEAIQWYEHCYMRLERPFRVHNVYRYPGWLERFKGKHPPEIQRLKRDIDDGFLRVETRDMEDARLLLESRWYRIARAAVRLMDPLERALHAAARGLLGLFPRTAREKIREHRAGKRLSP